MFAKSLALCATVFFALAAAAEAPSVFVVGDSISMQYGPYLEQYLAGSMTYARKSEDDPVLKTIEPKQGANGGDSDTVRAYIEAKEKAGGIDADILLLNCGLHDIKTRDGQQQVPIERYEENLNAILECAARMEVQVVWVRTTPVDDDQHNTSGRDFTRHAVDCARYNDVADTVMAARHVPSIDLHAFTSSLGLEPAELFSDHVHFPVPVREKQAAFIAGALTARFCE